MNNWKGGRPGLNSKPFRSTYVEKAYSTVDRDSSVGWGRYTWRPPWCFLRRSGYEPAPGFTFSLPFIIIPYNTITLHKQLHIQHPNLNFLQYTIQILVPNVMWSAQAVRDLKIYHTQRHLSPLRGTRNAY